LGTSENQKDNEAEKGPEKPVCGVLDWKFTPEGLSCTMGEDGRQPLVMSWKRETWVRQGGKVKRLKEKKKAAYSNNQD